MTTLNRALGAEIIDLSMERLMRRSRQGHKSLISLDNIFFLGAILYSATAWILLGWLVTQLI